MYQPHRLCWYCLTVHWMLKRAPCVILACGYIPFDYTTRNKVVCIVNEGVCVYGATLLDTDVRQGATECLELARQECTWSCSILETTNQKFPRRSQWIALLLNLSVWLLQTRATLLRQVIPLLGETCMLDCKSQPNDVTIQYNIRRGSHIREAVTKAHKTEAVK